MNLFYIHHHFQAIFRSKSFSGEVIAILLLGFMGIQVSQMLYDSLDDYSQVLKMELGYSSTYEPLIFIAFLFDLLMRFIIRRPNPKMTYYVLWANKMNQISWQYMITSIFGIMPFLFLFPQLVVALKSEIWLGSGLVVMGLFLSNHFSGLFFQFISKKIRFVLIGLLIVFINLVLLGILPIDAIASTWISPAFVIILLTISAVGAFLSISAKLKKRELFPSNQWLDLANLIPVVQFRNPLFQLEWALIVRNKRTRSNILMGMISILIIPFLLDPESPNELILLLFMIGTSFFIIQHGVYSLGWEGSYFDFLLANVSLKDFIAHRYTFYAGTCLIGFIPCLVATLVKDLDTILLVNMLLYNVGITIPLVLYRSVFNSTKIELSENSFMNYNGMMTGPIMVTSFLVVLLPFLIYGIGSVFFNEYASYVLGAFGLLGLILRQVLLNAVASFLARKKYHLSQSFK